MIIVWIVAKKNKLFSDKKFILYGLLSALILAVPALSGFSGYWFMPYMYVVLQLLYFLLGWLNMKYLDNHIVKSGSKYIFTGLIIFTVMLLGMALFSMIFNLCNKLQYGWLASTCILPFFIASLYRQTYRAYIDIPIEIYKVCSYDGTCDVEKEKNNFDIRNQMVVDVEIYKDLEDTDLLQITAKTSENLKFRSWFLIFLTDYNFKNPLKPINYYTELNNYGWIFYTKSSFFHRRHYIDPLLSFKENNIGPHSTIIARRAKDVSESGMTTESTILK
jgi:hypothetical protein